MVEHKRDEASLIRCQQQDLKPLMWNEVLRFACVMHVGCLNYSRAAINNPNPNC